MHLFAELYAKGQPGNSVHVGTALGNEDAPKRRKFVPQIGAFLKVLPRALIPFDEKRSRVPFPHDPAALASLRADQVPRFLGAITDPDVLPVVTVSLDDLTAVQNRVDTAKVKAWASGSIKSDQLPVVVKANGKHLIADGHHRLAGAWLKGDTSAKVRLKDLEPVSNTVKRAPLDWSMPLDVKKADPDQRLIFGWASVIEKNGVPIIDKQGDIIPCSALEPAVYDFVLYSREQGDMHEETGVGRMVESMMFTTEKQQALGVDLGMVGWWTGFKVDSPALWDAHKRGERPEFSIGGKAVSREA